MAIKYSDLGMSVKMRLYSLSKRNVLTVFLCFFMSVILSTNIGFIVPEMLKSIPISIANHSREANLKTGPFYFVTPYLNKFNDKLWITGKPIISGRDEEFSNKFNLRIILTEKTGKKTSFHSDNNRTRILHCKHGDCDIFNILHVDYLHEDHYMVELSFYGLTEISSLFIKDFIITFNSHNPSFTKFELWYRFFFLFCTFVVTIIYTRSLKKFSLRDWSIEQKWMFILLRSLLFFNNPLFPLCVIVSGWFPHILDAFFQSTFFSLVLVFWLSVFHGVRQNDRNFSTFYIPKFVIVFIIWVLSLILLLWQVFHEFDDPTYILTIDESSYIVIRFIFISFSILYLLFLLFLIIRAWAELRNTPYFDVRIKFSIVLMLVVISTLVTIGIYRYQTEAFRQSIFENFTKNYHSTFEFCAIFAIFNFYIYTLAFVYSPAKNASIENDFGDNPTFAMLNSHSDGDEDEEEVIYG